MNILLRLDFAGEGALALPFTSYVAAFRFWREEENATRARLDPPDLPQAPVDLCRSCQGVGAQRDFAGAWDDRYACPTCQGEGTRAVWTDPRGSDRWRKKPRR